ncbi:transcription termination factor Rho [Corynebacterium freiburgense]|uniref:transcription termination factor Rho n=1 Tax=Corynebacterium freiburgense TaxID=556548 RepID=UPI0004059618|nr:transcription termination factor Rho [Corynebacterium freiburgense]WJZ02366.1 hypothetical protein CFREI_05355 [Corynebacterium freiburgense]
MTDTDTTANLAALRLPELRRMAQSLGIRGISTMRKGALIEAIQAGGAAPAKAVDTKPENVEAEVATEVIAVPTRRRRRVTTEVKADSEPAAPALIDAPAAEEPQKVTVTAEEREAEAREAKAEERHESRSQARRARRNRARLNQRERERRERETQRDQNVSEETTVVAEHPEATEQERYLERSESSERAEQTTDRPDRQDRQERSDRGDRAERGERQDRYGRDDDRQDRYGRDDDRRNRRNRRDRGRNRRDREPYEELREDDVLQQIAGIVEVLENGNAFVRTSGYQAAAADVYVSSQMIRRFGLRRGDAIIGQIKVGGPQQVHGTGRNRQKYNVLQRVDQINGLSVEDARHRPEFAKLTPLYPNQRLRLETDPKILTTRVIDLIMPIGKGQRALIVSPPKAGKTTILQNVANAIATNNPECYLMVVLVDERPEEVTDMQRNVKGEVIASTFDRPPSEHTAVAELAIERAKRLVEQGQDVVVLLDSITRLGRAYNNSSPASGRILSGGVDSNALYPPKRFLGAARNIENGGSLTIIATAMVETGSAGDTVIFEEFKGTGNAELKLDRKISERRVFPAVDVNPSGTRKDELLLAPEEARIMHKLRRILSALDNQQAIDLLIKQLKKTKSNGEFLMQVASSAPMAGVTEEDFS